MSKGGDTRFVKGRSGNPKGRPKMRRPHVSAFDIIFDKTLTVTQNGVERELSVDEALQLQTYQSALKGSKMAIRTVLKMIEKREAALAKTHKPGFTPARFEHEYDADNANEAMRLLGIGDYLDEPDRPPENRMFRLSCWAAQAALSRPGKRKLTERQVEEVKRVTFESSELCWPKGRIA